MVTVSVVADVAILPIALMLGLSFLACLAIRPTWTISVMLFLLPLTYLSKDIGISVGGLHLDAKSFVYIFLFMTGIVVFLGESSLRLSSIPNIPYVLFLVFALITSTYSGDLLGSAQEILRLGSFFALLYITTKLSNDNSTRVGFLWSIALSSIIPLSVGFHQYLTRSTLYWGVNRPISIFDNPTTFGLFTLEAFAASLILLPFVRTIQFRLALIILMLLQSLAIYTTLSRAVWLSLVLLLAVWAWQNGKKRIVLGVIPVAIIALLILVPSIPARFANEFQGGELDGSYATRASLQLLALGLFIDNPIFGNGIGSIFYTHSVDIVGYNLESHGDAMKLLAETGIAGFSLYAAGIVGVFIALRNRIRSTGLAPFQTSICTVAVALLAVYCFEFLTDTVTRLAIVQWFFWAIMGIALSCSAASSQQSTSHQDIGKAGGI